MVAVYNGHEFLYITNDGREEILTKQPKKIDHSFSYRDGYFSKEVWEEELTDIYDVELWVRYQTGRKGVPSQWQITKEEDIINENGILLTFERGLIPGWTVTKRGVCKKRVPLSEISGYRVKIIYKKKDGITLTSNGTQERISTFSELNDLFNRYNQKSF